jgi:hypothetical protein
MNPKVNYKNFDAKFLSIKKPEKKTSKPHPTKPSVDYIILKLIYNYGTEEKPNWLPFDLEGPEFDTGGVRETHPKFAPTRTDYSILISFRPENPDHMEFLDVFDQIYNKCVELIYNVRFDINKKTFDLKAPKSSFLYPIYTPEDQNGPIEGKNKSFFLQLYERGPYKTLLTLPDKKTHMDKKDLMNLAVKLVPCISFMQIHVGTDMRFQTELRSAAIKWWDEKVIGTSQSDTIDQMLAENPAIAELMAEKLAKLMMSKQNLPPQKEEPPNTSSTDQQEDNKEQNLLDGIEPTTSLLPASLETTVNQTQKKKQYKIPTH